MIDLAWSTDGAWIASTGQDRRVRVSDATNGTDVIPPIESPATAAARVAFSADRRELFVTERDGALSVFDLASDPRGACVRRFALAAPTLLAAPDGSIAGFDRAPAEIDLFDRDGHPIGTLKPPLDFITRAAFSADSRRLGIGGFVRGEGRAKDGIHVVLELPSGKVLMSSRTPGTWAQSIAIAPDGTRLFSGCTDGSVRGFDVASGAQFASTAAHAGLVLALAVSRDGATLASGGSDRKLAVLDAATGQLVHSFVAHTGTVGCLAYSPDGRRVVSGGSDGQIRIFATETGELVNATPGHLAGVTALAPSQDGARIATASFDGTVRVWDATSGAIEVAALDQGGFVFGVAWCGDRLLAADQAGGVVTIDRERGSLSRAGAQGGISSLDVDFAPDGKRVVVACGDNVARIVDVDRGALIRSLHLPRGTLHRAAWSPDGTLVALATSELLLFDAETGAAKRPCEPIANPIAALEFFPDSSRVALACADERVRVVTVADGRVVLAPLLRGGRVQAVAVSPDGRLLAAASSSENVVRLLDAETGAAVGVFAGHDAPVLALAFSRDGRLWSGSMDTTVIAWRIPPRADQR